MYICIYTYIFDSQREKIFLKIYQPGVFLSYLYKTLLTIFSI